MKDHFGFTSLHFTHFTHDLSDRALALRLLFPSPTQHKLRSFRQSGLILSPFPTDLIGLNGCSIFPSSSAPNLAKQSLLLVLPHHFTFLPPLNILVRQQFVLLHFFTFNFTFQFNNIALWLLTLLWE